MKTKIISGHHIQEVFQKYTKWLLDTKNVQIINLVYNEDMSNVYECELAIIYQVIEQDVVKCYF